MTEPKGKYTKWVACWGNATSITDRREAVYAKDITLRYPVKMCFGGDRLRLRHELRDRWLGTYVYYYYTENNDPDQVMKPNSTQQSGVN